MKICRKEPPLVLPVGREHCTALWSAAARFRRQARRKVDAFYRPGGKCNGKDGEKPLFF